MLSSSPLGAFPPSFIYIMHNIPFSANEVHFQMPCTHESAQPPSRITKPQTYVGVGCSSRSATRTLGKGVPPPRAAAPALFFFPFLFPANYKEERSVAVNI